MPVSKRRKPKHTPKVVPRKEQTTSRSLSFKKLGAWLGGILSVGALGIALWPLVTIEPTRDPQASNPFSAAFKVANGQIYPIEAVHIQAYLWCVKMGTGTDTTPPKMCERGMPSSRPQWNSDIGPHSSREIVPGDVIFGTPNFVLYADISVKITYQLWFMPMPFELERRFYTRRKDDGQIEWLNK